MPVYKYEFFVKGKVSYTCFDTRSSGIYAEILDDLGVEYKIVKTSLI